LTAFFDHFLALSGIIDDVAILIGQIVFAHDGADALAPAARGFQVSDDIRFIHNQKLTLLCHKPGKGQSAKLEARLWTLNLGISSQPESFNRSRQV
jgi:hypothetical protein